MGHNVKLAAADCTVSARGPGTVSQRLGAATSGPHPLNHAWQLPPLEVVLKYLPRHLR